MSLDVEDFFDMVRAKIKVEEEEFDLNMQMLAWQTSILINAMGKSKKRYKPNDLYKPVSDERDKSAVNESTQFIGTDEKERRIEELKSIFGSLND